MSKAREASSPTPRSDIGRRLFLGGLAAAAASTGVLTAPESARADAGDHPLSWFDVTDPDYGAVGDNVADDTAAIQAAIDAAGAAGGGVVYFPAGIYKVAGPLQAGSNSQLKVPAVHALAEEQITIVLLGETPPPPIVSVIGDTAVPTGHSVIRSTLTSGSGGSLLGGAGPAGSYLGYTFVLLQLANLTFRMPPNPTHTGLNLSRITGVDLNNVSVDAGSYYVQGLAEPSTATSYGIRLPGNDNGAYTRVDAVNVIGFYTGFEIGEHTVGRQMTAWGCKRVLTAPFGHHASKIERLMGVHCQKGIVFTGQHYLDVDQFNLEHANTGWWVTQADVDDASNLGYGVIRWHVVKAGVGTVREFTALGGANLTIREIGYDGSGSNAWASYTPALTATGTNPTLGTGSAVEGRYSKSSRHVLAQGYVLFGSSGASAGSGMLRLSLPVPAQTTVAHMLVGSCSMYDSSSNSLRVGVLIRVNSTTCQIHLDGDGGAGFAQAGVPWTWSAGDGITFQLSYEAG